MYDELGRAATNVPDLVSSDQHEKFPAEKTPEQAFRELEAALTGHDPLDLLTQLSLTYLFVPENEFQGEAADTHRRARGIEFLTGLLLTRPYPAGCEPSVTGRTVERYFHAVRLQLMKDSNFSSLSDPARILSDAKIYSLHVRGEAYPHQFFEWAASQYGEHDDWFRTTLGFTIADAITIARAIPLEYARRNYESKKRAREEGVARAEEFVGQGEVVASDCDTLAVQIGCMLHYGNSTELLAFTADELASFSGVTLETCGRLLDRLSQQFGYRNPDFPKTFTDPRSAPWDYNTLHERPLICKDNHYWLVEPTLLPTAIFTTFYFDLMDDESYRATFAEARGHWLEREVEARLQRVFPADSVLLNPRYPSGDEFSDVVVLHDRKVLIFQCKSKAMRRESRTGEDLEALRTDLSKAVNEAFAQGLRARDYLNANRTPRIIAGDRELTIDRHQVSEIFLVTITPLPLQHFTTRFANHSSALGMFPNGEYPWSLSLACLDVLTELLPTPATFLHYVTRRLQVERTAFLLDGDEMDILGLYLAQGLYFDDNRFAGFNSVSIGGLSGDVDRYVWDKYERGGSPKRPKQPAPPGFDRFVRDVEGLDFPYKTDCAMALLDLSENGRHEFIEGVQRVKSEALVRGKPHRLQTTVGKGKRGISFIAMDARGDSNALLRQVEMQSIKFKENHRCQEWIGFGSDAASSRTVDVALYVA